MIHIAVIQRVYIELILAGSKTAEMRLTRTRGAPHGVVVPGERLYLKQSSGPVRATAVVTRVEAWTDLTPKRIARLQAETALTVRGKPEFFAERMQARYASVIHFDSLEPCSSGPDFSAARRANPRAAWLVLPESADVYPACLETGLFNANR